MKIRSQINGLLVAAALVLPLASGVALFAAHQVSQRMSEMAAAEELIRSATQLRQIAVETVLFHEARALDQWQRKVAGIKGEIDRMPIDTSDEKANLDHIRKNVDLAQIVYQRLSGTQAAPAGTPGTGSSPVDTDLGARTITSLFVITQEILDRGYELNRSSREDVAGALRTLQVLISLFILATGALIAFLWRLVSRGILQPLRDIEQGTQSIAVGDYAYRLNLLRHDEIGDLANEFDKMTARVQQAQDELVVEATHSRRAETALRESSQYIHAILDNAPHAIIAVTPEGVISVFNPAAERLLGYTAAEMVGKQTLAIFHDGQEVIERAREFSRELAEVIEPGFEVFVAKARRELPNEHEWTYLRKDGTRCPVSLSVTAFRDENAGIKGFFGMAIDISGRKAAESALADSARHTQIILENAGDGIITIDRDGTVSSFNHAAETIFGYASVEVLGHNVSLLMPEPYRSEHDSYLHNYHATGVPRIIGIGREVEGRRKDGSPFPMDLAVSSSSHKGQPLYIGLVRDISARKHADQVLIAAREEADVANRAKSDFLANMSHELRTPLNSIIGFSEMLRDGVLGKLDTKQRGFVTDIFDAGTHLLSLINDILDLSKVEAGMLQLEAEAVDIPALLKASTLVVREKALAHRIRLDTQLDPALGTMVADERKLKQIVYNLLSNAVKFTPDGGAVTLRARRCVRAEVALDETLPGRLIALPPGEDCEFLAIMVEDSGVGIAEEHLPKLFEPFMQVDSSVARRQAGTGLGLSLVRRLAELHGGTVGVASHPGAGSRFCVWLPYREATPAVQESGTAPEATAPSAPAVPLALVIEDDDRMAELIEAQLHAEGFEVMRAATAEEGLARAAKRRPQLITLDIFLPAMDGWEFMRRLRADPKLADTPVVIITVSEDLERSLALGARRVLQKPFARAELVAALAGLVNARPGGELARVLVVDDNVKAVELLATALEAEGYRVMRAYGGAEAIEVARSARPDLVILDLMMPEVSGFEIVHALRESEHTARIPILVLTAKDLTAEDHARLNGDVSAILAKASFSMKELLAELRRALPERAKD